MNAAQRLCEARQCHGTKRRAAGADSSLFSDGSIRTHALWANYRNAVIFDDGTVVDIGRLQDRLLRGSQLVHPVRHRSLVDAAGKVQVVGRETIEERATLLLGTPGQGPVNRGLVEDAMAGSLPTAFAAGTGRLQVLPPLRPRHGPLCIRHAARLRCRAKSVRLLLSLRVASSAAAPLHSAVVCKSEN